MSILKIDSVSKSYNGVNTLDKVSLEIREGERIVILGPSGCGKTTLLRMIAGFVAPDRGSIFIAKEEVSENGRIIKSPEQRNLGMVFQDLALWPHLSVQGNIDFGLRAKGVSKIQRNQRIREILELVGMAEYADRKSAELSGGQQQRIALARTLVLKPQLLLMDEPLSSLNQELNIKLRKEILRLQKKLSFTLVYVTHNREEAFAIASKVVLMSQGSIKYAGEVAGVKEYLSKHI